MVISPHDNVRNEDAWISTRILNFIIYLLDKYVQVRLPDFSKDDVNLATDMLSSCLLTPITTSSASNINKF